MSTSLLSELEPLCHQDRVRRVVELGRREAGGDDLARAQVAALAASPRVYARLLALMSLYGSRDGARVPPLFDDPSRTIRRAASRLVAVLCDDDQVGDALGRIVGWHLLRRTIKRLVGRHRIAPVDAFLRGRLRAGAEPRLVDLIPLGSAELVEEARPTVEAQGGPDCWSRLAARHPALYASWVADAVATAGAVDPRQRWRVFPALTELAERAPDATLALLRLLLDHGEEPQTFRAPLRALVRRRPREIFDLIRARHESGRRARPPGAFGVVRFDKVAHVLGAERLDYLVRTAPTRLADGKRGRRWFFALVPDDRAAVLRAFVDGGGAGWGAFLFRYVPATTRVEQHVRERAFARWSYAAQANDGTIAPDVLDWLPADLREREARRHLGNCAALVSKVERRLVYARLLPFGDARDELAPFLGHPEGEVRAQAQGVLLASLRHDRGAMTTALEHVQARRYEQDPVRRAIFEALVELPIACFSAGDLEGVGVAIQHALDAADLSGATAAAVERLVARLFRIDGAWGARWLARLLAIRGRVSTWGLGDGLTRAEAARLVPALAELAEEWTTRERASAIISLAGSLGIRLPVVTPLLDALEELARGLPYAGVAAAALGLIAEHDRARFVRLVPELLAIDRSFVLIPGVAEHLSARRQDLLGPFLGVAPMTGRFATGLVPWVLDFKRGHAWWTEAQQTRYAASLDGLLADPMRDVPTLRFAITTVARLAFVDPDIAIRYASDPRPPLREIAIRALPWLDAGGGVPVLLDCLGDERARYAIYALRKAFAEMPGARVLATLRAVPTTKVTVAKEVVRLLGELGGDDAYRELVALDQRDLHRDVRVALLRALWDHLDRPETWAAFERAVYDPDWIVAAKLADIPLGRLSDDAERRVVALLAAILGRAEPEARLALLGRAAYLPLRDGDRALFRRLLLHMGAQTPEEGAAAFGAVLHRMGPDEVDAVVARLAALAGDRRRLVAFIPILTARLGPYASKTPAAVAAGLLEALDGDPHAVPPRLALASRLHGVRELGATLVDLAERDLLHFDAMEAAMAAVRASAQPAVLDQLLGSQRDPRLRRLGLAALVEAARPKEGWSPDRRARLTTYRGDPSPAVAGPAAFVFPPE